MVKPVSNWFQKRFVNTEFGSLTLVLLLIILLLWWIGGLLTPVLVSIAIAYLLDRGIKQLQRWKLPHLLALNLIFLLFIGSLVFALLFLLPLLWDQFTLLLNEVPTKIKHLEGYITTLSQEYPAYVSKDQIEKWVITFQQDLAKLGSVVVAISIATISNIMLWVVYLVLVPLMVYFFLKDQQQILKWSASFLPEKRVLMAQVWKEINLQIGNYISAKILEILIIGFVCTLAFLILGLNYAILLGVLVGFSVLIPYLGVILVTIPVLIIGYMQWGFTEHFWYLLIVYFVLMMIDGNILTPLLFSERLKLHPVAVILAILIFGGLWGFWGIFFAIPLASTTKALLQAWMEQEKEGKSA